jgi:hypothetical protein
MWSTSRASGTGGSRAASSRTVRQVSLGGSARARTRVQIACSLAKKSWSAQPGAGNDRSPEPTVFVNDNAKPRYRLSTEGAYALLQSLQLALHIPKG